MSGDDKIGFAISVIGLAALSIFLCWFGDMTRSEYWLVFLMFAVLVIAAGAIWRTPVAVKVSSNCPVKENVP